MLKTAPTSAPELLYLLHSDPGDLSEALQGMRPADIAEALRALPSDAAAKVLAALPFTMSVQVFDDPELTHHRHEIVERMDEGAVVALIEAMSSDQQADLFREIDTAHRERLLKLLPAATRDALAALLTYDAHTAGGIMTTEFVSVPSMWRAEEALAYIREVGRAKETIYAIYVLDETSEALVHVVSLRELILAPLQQPVLEAGDKRAPITVRVGTDREEVARVISKYNLLAVPVVDDAQRVLGIVTVDDVIDAIVREQTEDAQKFGGMEALDAPYLEITFAAMVKKRAGWLAALFLSEMLTATAMQHYEHAIEKAVVLSMFIPLIMSSGGNSGSQATSLIIRAIALGEVRLKDFWKIAARELPTGLVLGSILGVIGVVRIVIWQRVGLYDYGVHYVKLAMTIGVALIGVVMFGSIAGSMLPFLLKRLGFDPASASAPFVATLVDVTGLVIYFTVATWILRGTLLPG